MGNTKFIDYLRGKRGRIYIARRGTITVFLLDDGSSYFCNNLACSNVMTIGPVLSYWVHSIDFAGGFSDYFTAGLQYDTEHKSFYPDVPPLNSLTVEQIKKLNGGNNA